MKITTLLIALLFICQITSNAQNIFRGKIWCCVKRIDHTGTNSLNGTGVLKTVDLSTPKFQFLIEFRENAGAQNYTLHDGNKQYEQKTGTWRQNNDHTITLTERGKGPLTYDITNIYNKDFLILTCKTNGDKWYLVSQ